MIQGLAPTYIAMNNQQLNIQQISTQPVVSQSQPQQAQSPQLKQQVNIPQGIINACLPQAVSPYNYFLIAYIKPTQFFFFTM